jgi:hypothetical protein
MQKLRRLLQIIHFVRHGRSMIQYEQWYQNKVELGIFNPAGIRMSSDDIGWQAATLLYMCVMEHLRRFADESPWLGATFDNSDKVKKQEFMCTFIFGLNAGRREPHLLRMYQLPNAAAKAENISKKALHVLCSEHTGEELHGEKYGQVV